MPVKNKFVYHIGFLFLIPLALMFLSGAGGTVEEDNEQTGTLICGSSLESMGYTLEVRSDFGVFIPEDVSPPVDGKQQSATYVVIEGGPESYRGKYAAYMLDGTYTYIAGIVPFPTGNYRIDFMYLQAFERETLQKEGAYIAVGNQTVPVSEFAGNPIYEDETVLVFDMYPLASPFTFSENLDLFVRRLYRVPYDGPPGGYLGIPPELPADLEHPDYTYLQETYDYIRSNIQELIRKEAADPSAG